MGIRAVATKRRDVDSDLKQFYRYGTVRRYTDST